MLNAILVPLDGSPWSAHALPTARALATLAKVPLHLIHVHVPVVTSYIEGVPIVDEELDAASRVNDGEYLETLRAQLSPELQVHVDVTDGEVAQVIAAKAATLPATLIVMTTHGRGGMARLWLGSVADNLIRHSHVPVLLVRPAEPPAVAPPVPGRILLPLDGSSAAEKVLDIAVTVGSLSGATFELLHIVDALIIGNYPFMPVSPIGLDEGLKDRVAAAESYLAGVAERLRALDLDVHTRVLVAEQVAPTILDAARETAGTMIAMATHGRGGLSRFVLGSVTDKVVRGTQAPVLLYHP